MIRELLRAAFRSIIKALPDQIGVRLMYFRHFKSCPNLRHPSTFSEKIAWRKLHQRDSIYKVYADKVLVKEVIARVVGSEHIIETLWVGEDPESIPFERLAPPYVIKTNHSSGGNVFVAREEDVRRDEIIDFMNCKLREDHGEVFKEWAYIGIQKKVLVERMLQRVDGGVPEDYKFFVYHGAVHFIQVDLDRFGNHRRNLYDREWRRIEGTLLYPAFEEDVRRPRNLQKMIELAELIGRGFDFVRVDLYTVPEGVFFGEVTFYPGSGIERFQPASLDLLFGRPWRLNGNDTHGRVAE